MATLNGLPRSWEPFIQGICSRRNLTKFSRLWEEWTQEDARIEAGEEKICEYDNRSLTNYTKNGKIKKEEHSHKMYRILQKNHKPQKDYSNFRCYSSEEKGHFARDFPKGKCHAKKGNKKSYHNHATKDDESIKNRAREYSSSDQEYV